MQPHGVRGGGVVAQRRVDLHDQLPAAAPREAAAGANVTKCTRTRMWGWFADVDEDGDLELLVGSDDYEIRIFKGEEVVSETTEPARIVALTKMRMGTFGYALANGIRPIGNRFFILGSHIVDLRIRRFDNNF